MKTVTEHLRAGLHERLGIQDETKHEGDFRNLRKTEWSDEFEELMRLGMIQGAFRYGLLGDESKPDWDRIPNMIQRLKLYAETGNTEHLVDVANLCLLEFVEGKHPDKHFRRLDDAGHHTEAKSSKF